MVYWKQEILVGDFFVELGVATLKLLYCIFRVNFF